MTRPRILCVDDEPHLLQGLQRLLHRDYDVFTAGGAEAALACLNPHEPFEVVMSDMRMPGMSGVALLAEVRRRAPDTVGLLLTGQQDLVSANLAVGQGQLFRFLTKPCPTELLSQALADAVIQHRLLSSEKVLLEQTLVGSLRALGEVLVLLHPEAFGAGSRRHERARGVALALGVKDAWHVEVASMLAPVGLAVLPSDVIVKLQVGAPLERTELAMTEQLWNVVERVLSEIPRLEQVRDVLKHSQVVQAGHRPLERTQVPVGALILDALHELSMLEAEQGDTARALERLQAAAKYEPSLLAAIARVVQPVPLEPRSLDLDEVKAGALLASDVRAVAGASLALRGQRVTVQLLQRLRNFRARGGVVEPILCEMARAPD